MLVGRQRERAALDHALERLGGGAAGLVLAIEGEPGIGKSRLLAELAERAADGCLVLGAAASEFEDDLPYAIWTEALDRHLRELGDRRLSRLGIDDRALAAVLPALGEPAQADRHAIHRALRELLDALAGPRPLVLWLDDLHWADPGSLDAIAALVRRPPSAPVLMALAAREGRLPQPVATALAAATREDRVARLTLTPLSESEAAELVGDDAAAIYQASGGNPFYLEQLARSRGNAGTPAPVEAAVPEAVALAIGAELADLAPETRRVLARRRRRRRPVRSRHRRRGRRAAGTGGAGRARRPARPQRSFGPRAGRGGSRSGTRSSAMRSTRARPAAGGSARTPARRPRSNAAGQA